MDILKVFQSLTHETFKSKEWKLHRPLECKEECLSIGHRTYITTEHEATGVKIAITLSTVNVDTKVEFDGTLDDVIYIAKLETPEGERRKGEAKIAMNDLLSLTDSLGATIRLEPVYTEVPKSNLDAFYESLGFEWISADFMERKGK